MKKVENFIGQSAHPTTEGVDMWFGVVRGLCSCQLSHPFVLFCDVPTELLAIQQQKDCHAQEHVPVDPASSASIQISHDVVGIACH